MEMMTCGRCQKRAGVYEAKMWPLSIQGHYPYCAKCAKDYGYKDEDLRLVFEFLVRAAVNKVKVKGKGENDGNE